MACPAEDAFNDIWINYATNTKRRRNVLIDAGLVQSDGRTKMGDKQCRLYSLSGAFIECKQPEPNLAVYKSEQKQLTEATLVFSGDLEL